jgi:hypothetical protein
MSAQVRDITYCQGNGCTDFEGCFLAFTPEIKQAAIQSGALVSFVVNPKEMPCYVMAGQDQRPEEVVVS